MNARWTRWRAPACLVALTAAAYANSFFVPFLFDDRTVVAENPTIRHLTDLGAVLRPPTLAGTGGRPLANLTFAVDDAISGDHVWSYHATNVLIHVLAVLTLWGLVRRTLALPAIGPRFAAWREPLGFFVAALWAVHPVNTNVVTYLSQRTEGLMGLCYLLMLYGLVRGATGPGRRWLVVSGGACWAGMACKEVMVTAPVAAVLFDAVLLAGSWRKVWRRWPYHAALAASWLFLAALMASSHPAQRGVGESLGITRWLYLQTETQAVLVYLKLCLWPHPLIFDYGPMFIVRFVYAAVPGAIDLALLVGSGVLLWRRPALGLCAVWFFLLLAPTSSFVPVFHQPVAENRLYLPSIGILALSVAAIFQLLGRRSGWVFGPAVVLLLGMTVARNRDYRSELSIWTATVEHHPGNSRAVYNLGCAEMNAHELPQAIAHFHRALQISPEYGDVHHNLGAALYLQGQLPEAIAEFERAVHFEPKRVETWSNLGKALRELGRLQEALPAFQEAVRLAPDLAVPHYNLGDLLLAFGRVHEALPELQTAEKIDPAMPEVHNDLGCVCLDQGRRADAEAAFREALRLRPDYAEAFSNLGNAQLSGGDNAGAAASYRQAIAANPNYAEAYSNLGTALDNLGRHPEALAATAEAIRLNPRQPVERYNYGNELAAAGRTEEARVQYEAALALSPTLEPAKVALKRLQAVK